MDTFSERNITNPTKQNFGNMLLPFWQQLVWWVLFGVMICIATAGNAIVMWIVLAYKHMRSVSNYFLVNLSLADLMISTLNIMFGSIYIIGGDWLFGEAYCKFSNFIAIVSLAASVFTLMAIAFDRYMVIMYPLKPRLSRSKTLCICLWIWVSSILLSLPNLLYSVTREQHVLRTGKYRVICYRVWPDGAEGRSHQHYVYTVVILVVTYVLPITFMTFSYVRVGRELWGSQSIGERTQNQVESINSKRKIVKMMIVVVVIFVVCWLPYHVFFLVKKYIPQNINQTLVQNIYLSIYWLAMSNSCYNPFIYCWMNNRFRQGFYNVIRCCRWQELNIHPMEQQRFTENRQNTTNDVIALQTCRRSHNHSEAVTPNFTTSTP